LRRCRRGPPLSATVGPRIGNPRSSRSPHRRFISSNPLLTSSFGDLGPLVR
jgi:hypothetical protein